MNIVIKPVGCNYLKKKYCLNVGQDNEIQYLEIAEHIYYKYSKKLF